MIELWDTMAEYWDTFLDKYGDSAARWRAQLNLHGVTREQLAVGVVLAVKEHAGPWPPNLAAFIGLCKTKVGPRHPINMRALPRKISDETQELGQRLAAECRRIIHEKS